MEKDLDKARKLAGSLMKGMGARHCVIVLFDEEKNEGETIMRVMAEAMTAEKLALASVRLSQMSMHVMDEALKSVLQVDGNGA